MRHNVFVSRCKLKIDANQDMNAQYEWGSLLESGHNMPQTSSNWIAKHMTVLSMQKMRDNRGERDKKTPVTYKNSTNNLQRFLVLRAYLRSKGVGKGQGPRLLHGRTQTTLGGSHIAGTVGGSPICQPGWGPGEGNVRAV